MAALSESLFLMMIYFYQISKLYRGGVSLNVEHGMYRILISCYSMVYFLLQNVCFQVDSADVIDGEGQNISEDITPIPQSPSTSQDPADMSLDEYRQAFGGSLPPAYSLAAATVGAAILLLLMMVVGGLTLLHQKCCSRLESAKRRRASLNSADPSKSSTSSGSRPLQIQLKKKHEKNKASTTYQQVSSLDAPENATEMKVYRETDLTLRDPPPGGGGGGGNRIFRSNKSDLRQHPHHHEYSRRSSGTTPGSTTPRELYMSVSSVPSMDESCT